MNDEGTGEIGISRTVNKLSSTCVNDTNLIECQIDVIRYICPINRFSEITLISIMLPFSHLIVAIHSTSIITAEEVRTVIISITHE